MTDPEASPATSTSWPAPDTPGSISAGTAGEAKGPGGRETGTMGTTLGLEGYRSLYEHCPDGVFFTAPDGRVLAANRAACEVLRLTEDEICARGRQGLADSADGRWSALLHERHRAGRVVGVARMIRGDGVPVEIEMAAQIFTDAHGEQRTCTVVRDVTERVHMERRLVLMSEELRELALSDELTGLRNRRGLVNAGSHLLELADREGRPARLLLLDVDNMKELNDDLGHTAGDSALRAVALALTAALRRADLVARIGGDEFVALTLGLDAPECGAVEERIRERLRSAATVAEVGRTVEVSVGWAARPVLATSTVEDLLAGADSVMYEVKAQKAGRRVR